MPVGTDRKPSLVWSENHIKDPEFNVRFTKLPEILRNWTADYLRLSDAEILDFGCGEGITGLALVLKYGARRVEGIDIMPDPERCLPAATAQLGLQELPDNLILRRVQPGQLGSADAKFDLVYSWSAFEHVDESLLRETIGLIRSAMKQRGLLFIQIAPLFYSAEGSHLHAKLKEPWAHLLHQHSVLYEKLAAAVPDHAELAGLWSTFRTLNKITASELLALLQESGFQVLRTHSTKDNFIPPRRLTAIFREEILTANQIVVLARPA